MQVTEKWLDIPNYKGLYQVSDQGQVRSLSHYTTNNRFITGRVRCLVDNGQGYLVINLSDNGVITQYRVHTLVALVFIPNPKNKPEINHKDGDKANNNVSNLEWNTHQENTQHRSQVLGKGRGEASGTAKFTNEDILQMRKMYNTGSYSVAYIARKYNGSYSNTYRIVTKQAWKHI